MKDKLYDPKHEATHLAKVLKYNPEYLQDEAKFNDLVTIIEVRMMQAFEAGRAGKIQGEVIEVSAPSTKPITESKEWVS
jgi:hypothetical protein